MRASTTSGCVARQRRYSSMNSSESGCPLSSSMAWASDMGAGTTSFKRVLGLYQCIICIGPPLSTSVQALSTLGACSLPRRARMALNGRVHSAKGECALYLPSFLVIQFSETQKAIGNDKAPGFLFTEGFY